MKEGEMRQIGRWIADALNHRSDAQALAMIRKQVLALSEAFPLYAQRRARFAVKA
jgi:glycine/serine hydroxymethyltransferase